MDAESRKSGTVALTGRGLNPAVYYYRLMMIGSHVKLLCIICFQSTKLETERKHVRDMLNQKRSELTKAEDKMYKACGTQSYDNTLNKYTTTVEKLQV